MNSPSPYQRLVIQPTGEVTHEQSCDIPIEAAVSNYLTEKYGKFLVNQYFAAIERLLFKVVQVEFPDREGGITVNLLLSPEPVLRLAAPLFSCQESTLTARLAVRDGWLVARGTENRGFLEISLQQLAEADPETGHSVLRLRVLVDQYFSPLIFHWDANQVIYRWTQCALHQWHVVEFLNHMRSLILDPGPGSERNSEFLVPALNSGI